MYCNTRRKRKRSKTALYEADVYVEQAEENGMLK